MLTILETYTAIKSLDTEPDIITNACKKVLGLGRSEDDDPNTIASEIVLTYYNRLNPDEFVAALSVATGTAAGLAAKRGKEVELLRNITKVIMEQMMEVRVKKIKDLAEKDPRAATEEMMQLLGAALESAKGKKGVE